MSGEFEPLRLTSGKSRERLSQTDVIQTDGAKRSQPISDLLGVSKKLYGLGNRQIQDLSDVEPAIFHFKNLFTKTAPMALGTRSVDIREKLHLDFLESFAATSIASSAFYIEGESGRGITPKPR